MTPIEFLTEVVQPNVAELEENHGSLRHAFNAVAAVDALASRIYWWCETHNHPEVADINGDSFYRESLAKKNASFRLLRDSAKAQKHDRLEWGNPLVTDSGQIVSRGIGIGECVIGETAIGEEPRGVVGPTSGSMRHVNFMAREALTFLEAEMKRVGIL